MLLRALLAICMFFMLSLAVRGVTYGAAFDPCELASSATARSGSNAVQSTHEVLGDYNLACAISENADSRSELEHYVAAGDQYYAAGELRTGGALAAFIDYTKAYDAYTSAVVINDRTHLADSAELRAKADKAYKAMENLRNDF